MQVTRQTLLETDLLKVVHARARPSPERSGEIEGQGANVLVLPLAGVFALHEGPHRHAIATPGHAVFVAADRPYAMSLLADAGDECLTLRFSGAALARLLPEAESGDGFDLSAFESCVALPADLVLARSLLWRRLATGAGDALEVEEAGTRLLIGVLHAARKDARARFRSTHGGTSGRRLRQVGRVLDAVTAQPECRWTLDALAQVACVSPGHLAHVFREEAQTSLHQFVLRARLAKALDAVLDTDADLTSIAHEMAFASHSHFTARFRALFGLTPVELRRSRRRGIAGELRRIVTARRPAPALG
jgi:AraC-like DNA-binding protein